MTKEGSLYQDTLEKITRALFQVQIINFMCTMLLKPFRVKKVLGSKSPTF